MVKGILVEWDGSVFWKCCWWISGWDWGGKTTNVAKNRRPWSLCRRLLRLQNHRNQSNLQMQRRHRDLEKTVILWWAAITMKMISSARIKQRFGFVIFVSLPPVLRDFSASVPWPLWWLDFFGSGHIYGHGLEISKSAQTVLCLQLQVQVLKWVNSTPPRLRKELLGQLKTMSGYYADIVFKENNNKKYFWVGGCMAKMKSF